MGMWMDRYTAREKRGAHPALAKCESPIETVLLNRLLSRWPDLDVRAQVEIGRYRVDLLIAGWLVVECDGRAFHSSPKQRARDHIRDTFLRSQGFAALRLTGTQIHRGKDLQVIEAALAGPRVWVVGEPRSQARALWMAGIGP